MIARLIIAALIFIPMVTIAVKILFLGYLPELLLPEKSYKVNFILTGDSDKDKTSLKTYIPSDDFRQKITDITYTTQKFDFAILSDGINKQASWQSFEPTGEFSLTYQFSVNSKAVSWIIPETLEIPKSIAPNLRQYLQSTKMMPQGHPKIQELYDTVVGKEKNVLKITKKVFNYVAELETTSFKGSTSAVTAYILQKASCNGKGHLMATLLRKAGLPTKLIGGLILEQTSKRTSHQWLEVYINDTWVAFDPTNKYFASIPGHYLTVYANDKKFFSHSKNIGFDWKFSMGSFLSPPSNIFHLEAQSFNFLKYYALFKQANLSLGILTILLMIPVGGLIATFFRNVIGTQTFGTFLPALIAAASYQTGVWWGLFGFSAVIFVLALIRLLFEKMDLMHTPKLSAMLTVVVMLVLFLSAVSVQYTGLGLERLSLFPIAILTLTTERFSITVDEDGISKAMFILCQTLFVTFICYLFMSNLFLQVAFLAFPELSILLIGLNMVLGRWVGIRLTEFYRFRSVIFAKDANQIRLALDAEAK